MAERKRTKHLNVRLTDEETRMLEALAQNDGLSISDWIRQSVRHAFRRTFTPAKPTQPKK